MILNNTENEIDLKIEFFKYLSFWKYILFSLIISCIISYFYIRYSNPIFEVNSKFLVLDQEKSSMKLPSVEDLFENSEINIENDLEVLLSSPILGQVVDNLDLQIVFTEIGDIKNSRITKLPFFFKQHVNLDNLKDFYSFDIFFENKGVRIINLNLEKEYFFKNYSFENISDDLPFIINTNNDIINKLSSNGFNISYNRKGEAINDLKSKITATKVGRNSHVINLKMTTSCPELGEIILNDLVDVFNKDGINDRRLIHKRTIDFVNARYQDIANELSDIENQKKYFKEENNFLDVVINSNFKTKSLDNAEKDLLEIENKINIANLIFESLKSEKYELIPSNIIVGNFELNNLFNEFNKLVLERNNLITSAGEKNPSIINLNTTINAKNINIRYSLENYLLQLQKTKEMLSSQFNNYSTEISQMPENEKVVREIERTQNIKESLYLFLLQKKEESQVSFAITEPSLKVVEYADYNGSRPIFPNKTYTYLLAIFIGFLFPISIIFFLFYLDDKIHSRAELEALTNESIINLGEIPFLNTDPNASKIFQSPNDRSLVSESYRMLMSNVKYLLNTNNKCNTIIITSSIKGEGKTLTAFNLSLAFASLDKRVLLIGCDLRNPQLHTYLNVDKGSDGLVNYLVDNKFNWENALVKNNNFQNHDILLSGYIPPNPLSLMNNGNFEKLLDDAKNKYDLIFIDSAPTLLVPDTLDIAKFSDAIVYLLRANHTNKEIINAINNFVDKDKMKNLGVLLNGVGANNVYGYAYNYAYQYGYKYNYSYNYGYGYGYTEDT